MLATLVAGSGASARAWSNGLVAHRHRSLSVDQHSIYGLGPASQPCAAGVTRSCTVALPGADQTISFAALPNKTFGDPDFALTATASSGLLVSFTAIGNCTISGSTAHITGAGACTVTASQAGDANYNAAPSVSQTFAVAKANQTISFPALANKKVGNPDFAVTATASSGLPVSFSAIGTCTISRSTVHITSAGRCTITASQAGTADYNPAPLVSQAFAIAEIPPKAKCHVPAVIGKPLPAAKRAIIAGNCRVGKISYVHSRKTAKGRVSSLSRRAGTFLPPEARVSIVVSLGRRR